MFSEGQPRQHAKVKGLIEKQISWKLNLQERKSVKIGGVTKAPEESGGGNSLQFLQVHFKLFLRDELQNLLFFLKKKHLDAQEVTSDVLARGIFSERGLKSAIDSAVNARLGKVGKVFDCRKCLFDI